MTEAGSWLGGRYELLNVIGRGGMAEVWKARDHRLGRDVAIKRLRADLASDETFQARFQREAQSAAGLNHPNIVSVYDTGEGPDQNSGLSVPYIVMELVQGHTLRDVLRDDRKILPERALEFTQGVLDALSYSHAAGIVHRDIKPANVMLTETGQVKVMDFGIARAVSDTSATMTQTAAVIGTAQYLSPEQARGEVVDNRADIYATGCLLYELLVGRPPFLGDSPVSVAYQHVREIPAPPSSLDPEITPAMDAITLKALAKAPADRYQTAKQMHDDIARVLAGQMPLAPLATGAAAADESTMATQVIAPAAISGTAVRGTPVSPDSAGYATGYGTTTSGLTPVAPGEGELDSQETKEPVKKRKRWPIVLVVVLVVLALGVGGAGLYQAFGPGFGSSSTPTPTVKMVKVPAVTGMSQEGATSTLANANLKAKVTTVRKDDATAGQVIGQDPARGRSVAEGSTITITVNQGPKKLTVPTGLEGMSESAAKSALTSAGFASGDIAVKYEESSTSDPGTVTGVSPSEGTEVDEGTSVTLTVASAPAPQPTITKTVEPTTAPTSTGGDTSTSQPADTGGDGNGNGSGNGNGNGTGNGDQPTGGSTP
ncbi:MAG: Stk1 family PASTA domain-containing Ser/Thr kinase [Acidipropionibacterium acidipropionici]|jgi:tRNA A-37 threonylcarbamoyl transferase component Bud32|uniref:Stk1 family PASTA domain-containing Ser/Thr kinase n=1 Tax=Acidipropionibacterium acidipropionici TaxID=1748 RepID=UPI002F35EEB7